MMDTLRPIGETLEKPDYLQPGEKSGEVKVEAEVDDAKISEIWKIVMENIKLNASARTVAMWYSGVYLEKVENGVAHLSCDNSMKREWIENNHRTLIRNKIQEIIGYKPDLVINIRTSAGKEQERKEVVYEYFDPSSQQQSLFGQQSQQESTGATSSSESPIQSNLNPRYRLDNFIVGSGNQLAFAVAESIVQAPGTAYNPVFFFGPSGVGKTHLMQGVGNMIIEKDPLKKVIYVPIETFMNEMIEGIRLRKTDEFRQKYRPIDVLIIDDIQFLSTYKKTKEEVFNTFNALYQANKQIIIASDRPPKEIENLPDRLRTRFEGGMVVDIQLPDFETRMAILMQREREIGAQLPSELRMFLAQNLQGSVRELEGAVTKLVTSIKLTKQIPTQDQVAKMLQIDIESKRKKIKPDMVTERVAEVFGISTREIRGKRRTAYVALARQAVMYLLRDELELPLEKIAAEVNRKDHTTVLHACEKIESLIEKDSSFKEKLGKCRELITTS